MRSKLLTFIRGSVAIEVRGEKVEWFLNRLLHQRMYIWDIRRKDLETLVLHIHIRDFFRLRPLLKETGCRVKVIARYGFPFWLVKMEKQKTFVFGLILFVVGLYMLSSIVWDVEVRGTETVSRQTVLETAKEIGIYRFQWKFRLDEPDRLAAEMTRRLQGVSWVGVNIEGTKVTIEIVESTQPELPPLVSPRHLVAAKDAVVSQIIAEKGKPVVQPNTRVKKGDVLISGLIGEEGNTQIIAAEGTVTGWVWYEYELNVPLIHKRKVFTGETQERRYLLLGQRALKISGFGDPGFKKSESIFEEHKLSWRGMMLPIGWMHEKVMEVDFVEERLDVEKARRLALERARADVLREAGEGAEITDEKILLEKREEKRIRMKILFEVDQNIAVEQPLVPGMGSNSG